LETLMEETVDGAPDVRDDQHLIDLTAGIVPAYVAHNALRPDDLPSVIRSVHEALAATGREPPAPIEEPPVPPVPIRRSITPDFLISLEDGKPYKVLKRHLAGFGLTPEAYRSKWGLPGDYPMVAPNYSARRSALAKAAGLGRRPSAPEPAPVAAPRRRRAKADQQ
jgi:predicted transcriptional regulator